MALETQTREPKYRILLIGIFILCLGLYFSRYVFTLPLQLHAVGGVIHTAQLNVETVTSRTSRSQRATLTFFLQGNEQKYVLQRNIGDDFFDPEYAVLRTELLESDSVTVMIKNSEAREREPKVYEIEINGEIAMARSKALEKDRFLLVLCTVMGGGLIALFFVDRRLLK